MSCTLAKFLELYEHNREDDKWDYKRQIELSRKSEKFSLVKDILSFANYGGGHILIGIDKDNTTIVNVENIIDPTTIAEIIERNAGLDVKFDIAYFTHQFQSGSARIGIIYIHPSPKILYTTKDLVGEDNKIYIGQSEVYTRRNTRCIKASPEEIHEINSRIRTNSNTHEVINDKYNVYLTSIQRADALWAVLENKYELTTESLACTIRGMLWFSKHEKRDFAQLTGVNLQEMEDYLLGKRMPPLELLHRLSVLMGMPLQLFFQPTYFGRPAFWKEDGLRFVLLRLVKPFTSLRKISDVDAFLGKIVYETAKAILSLEEYVSSDSIVEGLSEDLSKAFKFELAHQHYKLLEQGSMNDERRELTRQEHIIGRWFSCSGDYLSRIFVESIKEIKVLTNGQPNIVFHFNEEIRFKEIYGRDYDQRNMKMRFGSKRFPAT